MKRGFTLVEIVVITAIIFFMAALTLPRLSATLKSNSIHQFHQDVLNLFADAKTRGAEGTSVFVRISDTGDLEMTQADTSGNDQSLKTVALPDGVTLDEFQLNDSSSTQSDWKIGFYTDGKSDRGMFTIVESGGNRQYRVLSTGRVVLVSNTEDPDPEEKWEAGQLVQRGTS